MKELISIVVPIYNVEKFLSECIESILNQSYKNLEILLIDDGSTDGSGKICDEYLKKDSRIKVIHKKNGGLSDARNTGTLNSHGKYICYLDSDDYIEKDYVKLMYKAIKKNKTNICQCGINYVDESGKYIKSIGYDETSVMDAVQMIKDMYLDGRIENIVAWNRMYKTEIMKRNLYPVGKIHEDEFVTYRVLYEEKNISVIKEKLHNYRQQSSSIMKAKYSLKRLHPVDAYFERIAYFKENNENELYYLCMNYFLLFLRNNAYKVLNELKEEKIYKDLIKNYRKVYLECGYNKYVRITANIRNFIFYVSPFIYYKIFKI